MGARRSAANGRAVDATLQWSTQSPRTMTGRRLRRPSVEGMNMKLLLLLALLLTLDACQGPGRFQAPQIGVLVDSAN